MTEHQEDMTEHQAQTTVISGLNGDQFEIPAIPEEHLVQEAKQMLVESGQMAGVVWPEQLAFVNDVGETLADSWKLPTGDITVVVWIGVVEPFSFTSKKHKIELTPAGKLILGEGEHQKVISGVYRVWSSGPPHMNHAFAALLFNGSVVTWGDKKSGGDSSAVANEISADVEEIFSTTHAYAAHKSDGSVWIWGRFFDREEDRFVCASKAFKKAFPNGMSDVKQISCTADAFAFLHDDGSVSTWGSIWVHASEEGNYCDSTELFKASFPEGMQSVQQIVSTMDAFAALGTDGSVRTWGSSKAGGDSSNSKVAKHICSGVTCVTGACHFFRALKGDGSTWIWGNRRCTQKQRCFRFS